MLSPAHSDLKIQSQTLHMNPADVLFNPMYPSLEEPEKASDGYTLNSTAA